MRTKLILTLALFSLVNLPFTHAQQYNGYIHDGNAGIHGLSLNPASIAGSKHVWDINLASMSFMYDNDFFSMRKRGFLGLGNLNPESNNFQDFKNSSIETDYSPFTRKNYTLNGGFDLYLPSIMHAIDNNQTLAFTWRLRSGLAIDEFDSELANLAFEGFDLTKTSTTSMNFSSFSMDILGWYEYGFAYAGTFNVGEEGKDVLNLGFNFKFLNGSYGGYFSNGNTTININNDTTASLNSTLYHGSSNDFSVNGNGLYKYMSRGFGAGLDLGLEYIRMKDEGYAYKLGFAVNDLGSIRFDKDPETFDRTGTVTNYDFTGVNVRSNQDFKDTLNSLFPTKLGSNSDEFVMNLPLALNFYTDINLGKNYFLSALAHIAPKMSADRSKIHGLNSFTLTPRYEDDKFSIGAPISVNQLEHFDMGLYFRFGPLFLGANDLFNNLVDNQMQGFSIFGGIKLQFNGGGMGLGGGFGGSTRVARGNDADRDGVPDVSDDCPELAGTIENNGCPFGDKDNDGVLDHADKCIDVAGPTENNGCPLSDYDNDGVYDVADNCIDVAGPVENNGCPYGDVDGDGVLDRADECIGVPGPVANNGCPILSSKEIGIVDDAIKNLEFAFGNAKIRSSSFKSLDNLARLLKENPTWKLRIEGHTDNVGGANANLLLSERRANAVKRYLMNKGVRGSNIKANWYGETRPVASNDTEDGRQKNRRVEMGLEFK